MDDDQFQGNLNVQGGYPESDAPVESGAAEQQVPAEPESEMSRRMNEMLGGFDNGITTGSGNSEVAQSAVPGNNTPLPDYAQQTPAQAEPVAQNNAFYDTNDTPESYAAAPADIAQQPTGVPTPPPVSTSFFDAATGATPVMTGTPRSNIEQAAAEQAAQAAAASNKKSHAKILLAIILIILVIAGAGAAIYIGLNGNTTRNNGTNNDNVTSENNNNVDNTTLPTNFEDLTKEEALNFLRSQTDIAGTLPENYVGEEISSAIITNGNTIVSDLDLIYSYDTIEELKEMAHKKYSGFNFLATDNTEEYDDSNFEIAEYDYYAIVTPKRAKGATSCDHGYNKDCDSLLSFKRSYLDHHQEETTPNSYNDVYYINTQNPDIINYLLRVYTFFSRVGFVGGHGNIYSYIFEEQDDKYILTVNNIGAGINTDLLKNPDKYTDGSEMYAINLYLRRFAADKSDGRIYTIPAETGVTEDVKSFPITEEELRSLPGYNN